MVGRQKPDIFDIRELSNVFRVKGQVIGDADGGDKNILSTDQVGSPNFNCVYIFLGRAASMAFKGNTRRKRFRARSFFRFYLQPEVYRTL